MAGGAGDDTYIVDSPLDSVTESVNSGVDTVESRIWAGSGAVYTLGANQENLDLGAGAFHGTGNADVNTLTGNAENNTMTGARGNDTLYGLNGNDTLIGDVATTFDSADIGADTMVGGAGDDIYYVNTTGDVVMENVGEGLDTVRTEVSGVVLPLTLKTSRCWNALASEAPAIGNTLNQPPRR